jgi:hypothetical protein
MINQHSSDSGIYKLGDIVIGSSDPSRSVYSADGAKIDNDGVAIYGSEKDLSRQSKEFVASVTRNGGVLIPANTGLVNTKKKTSKTKKTPASRYMQPQQPESSEIYHYADYRDIPTVETQTINPTVQFENDFGKIKAKVEHFVEQELAVMLIFKDEESLIFEPKTGETLTLHTPEKTRLSVYYPGVTFDSPDSNKKFMILFKVPEENQE